MDTLLGIALLLIVTISAAQETLDEVGAPNFLQRLNKEQARILNKVTLSEWAYASNITDENLKVKLAADIESAQFMKVQWKRVQNFHWRSFQTDNVRRQFSKLSVLGTYALPEAKLERFNKVVAEMSDIYSTAKVCKYPDINCIKPDLSLEPEITDRMAESEDPNELKHLWVEWRRLTGRRMRLLFKEYVELNNEAARLNNFSDASEMWLKDYEAPNIRDQFAALWDQLRPAYMQVHAFVRHELRRVYGPEIVSENGPIPAHLFGNMWAQTWNHIAKRTLPYPDLSPADVTQAMRQQGYTPLKMFKLAEEFFVSLNLSAMPADFWKKSIIEKPLDRDMVCHASAWDFYDGKDFRIKMCTSVNIEDLSTVHHEMGHIQYDIQYSRQPAVYREGANPGFHEAIGDVMALSVGTQQHLRQLGLITGNEEPKAELNHLYANLLSKVVFLPFAYLVDQFRWRVFRGEITLDSYNCEWWRLRESIQGVEPPVDRVSDDFDPGAKYHVPADVPYIRYFVSHVIQFQFQKSLCEIAGQYPTKPLHQCDIYKNKDAGNKLKAMLQMGASRPWPEAMQVVTGQREMDASGLLEYYRPILDYITKKNQENGVHIGWESSKRSFGCQK